jgi:hypothetical protein
MTSARSLERRFQVFGPFPFDTTKGVSHPKRLLQFWSDREADGCPEGLPEAVGVYVWTFKEGAKRIPWNIGITSKQGFKGRFTQKELSIRKLQDERPNAEIEVYLLARRTKTGGFSRTRQKKLNDWLETTLIGAAYSINPEGLRNTAKSKFLRTTVVDGYLNDAEDLSDAARSFRAVFKAQSRKRKNVGTR